MRFKYTNSSCRCGGGNENKKERWKEGRVEKGKERGGTYIYLILVPNSLKYSFYSPLVIVCFVRSHSRFRVDYTLLLF